MNTLYYGDNLKILRDYIKDESVDLIYLEPTSSVASDFSRRLGQKNDPALAETQYGIC